MGEIFSNEHVTFTDNSSTCTMFEFTCANGYGINPNYLNIIKSGSFELRPPTLADNTATDIFIYMLNSDISGGSGSLTTSGFDKVSGDPITATDGDMFFLRITAINRGGSLQYSTLNVEALQ